MKNKQDKLYPLPSQVSPSLSHPPGRSYASSTPCTIPTKDNLAYVHPPANVLRHPQVSVTLSRSLPSEYPSSAPSDVPISYNKAYFQTMASHINRKYLVAPKRISSGDRLILKNNGNKRKLSLGNIDDYTSTILTYVSSASLSVPDLARLNLDPFRRSHRHSIPNHRLGNYLKFLNELSTKRSSTAHLFSTAVISGSSSAPNLKEMPRPGEGHGKSNSVIWMNTKNCRKCY